MKIKALLALILLLYGVQTRAGVIFPKFDKTAFYAVIKNGNKGEIDNELELVAASTIVEKGAYEGFLLMRKAGLITLPAQKLKLFKEGCIKLETAIAADGENAEYHFLRLIIEEKAPKIVKYHNDIEADKQITIKAYKKLPEVVQQAIADYSKNSKVLQPQDL